MVGTTPKGPTLSQVNPEKSIEEIRIGKTKDLDYDYHLSGITWYMSITIVKMVPRFLQTKILI